jgi:hypothetical protein
MKSHGDVVGKATIGFKRLNIAEYQGFMQLSWMPEMSGYFAMSGFTVPKTASHNP